MSPMLIFIDHIASEMQSSVYEAGPTHRCLKAIRYQTMNSIFDIWRIKLQMFAPGGSCQAWPSQMGSKQTF